MTEKQSQLIRKLNFLERLEWEIGNGLPFNAVMHLVIPSVLKESTLKILLEHIKKRHLLLSAKIIHSNGYYEFEHSDQPIFLTYKVLNDEWIHEDQKNKILFNELNTAFDRKSLLIRCCCYVSQKESLLIITLHHAIADGLSGLSLTFELLQMYDHQLLGYEIESYQKPLLPPLESMLPDLCNMQSMPYSSAEGIPNQKNNAQSKTFSHTFSFSRNETKIILAQCKSKDVTVQGLLTAAGILTLLESLQIDVPWEIMTHHLVNMRRYLSPEVSNDEMGCLISQINVPIKIANTETLWDIAHDIASLLGEAIDSGAHFDTLSNLYTWLIQNPTTDCVQEAARVKSPVFSLSNLGKVTLPDLSHPLLVPTELHALVTIHNLYPEKDTLMAVAMTYCESLSIAMLGSTANMTETFLFDFSVKFKKLILKSI